MNFLRLRQIQPKKETSMILRKQRVALNLLTKKIRKKKVTLFSLEITLTNLPMQLIIVKLHRKLTQGRESKSTVCFEKDRKTNNSILKNLWNQLKRVKIYKEQTIKMCVLYHISLYLKNNFLQKHHNSFNMPWNIFLDV